MRCNIGILGATGAVGREMIKILEERRFPVGTLRLLASEHSAGERLSFCGVPLTVERAEEKIFEELDIVFGATDGQTAKHFAPALQKAGVLFIDNSSAFRLTDGVPLVVPEINADDAFSHRGIVANPNCTTVITLIAVNALRKLSPLIALVAATYQAVSGAGAQGIAELQRQTAAWLTGTETENVVFPHRIASNVLPKIGEMTENGYTAEENKLQNESRKILHLPDLKVSCTCVRVPVMRSHSVAVTAVTKDRLDVEKVRRAISAEKGCVLCDDAPHEQYPMPILSEGRDLVYIGRVRNDTALENAVTFFCCGDQLRKGAATNAIQIAELFVR